MNLKFKKAIDLHRKGQLEEAKKVCLEVLKLEPNNFNILHLLGIIAFQKKNYKVSDELISKAIKIKPDFADAYTNRGIVLKRLNKLEDALRSWDKAIKLNSKDFKAYNHRGIALIELKRSEDAIKSWKNVININPNYAEAYNNIGNALNELKRFDESLKKYNEAIKIRPNFAEAYNNRANVLRSLNQLKSALDSCNIAIKIRPNFAEAYNNRGIILVELKQLEAALESYESAIKINPDEKFLLGRLISTKKTLCNWSSYKENLKKLEDNIEKGKKSSVPFHLLSIYDMPKFQKKFTELFVKEEYPTINNIELINKRKPNKKIRIGYYSADFRDHPVSFQLVQLLELHDRSKFEIIGFSFSPGKNDAMKKRISKTFDKFYDIKLKTDIEIVKLSRNLKIDIAVDLMGFTKYNRFRIFVERCAPIQINYLGYSGTISAKCIDYIIGDKVLIPERLAKDYSEKIIYLPNSFMINDSKKKISNKIFFRKKLGLPEKGFVFCCFNPSYKITPNIFDIWMKLLNCVEGSVFWLSESNQTAVKNLQREADKRKVNPKRIVFAKRMPSLDDHLARHKIADLFLDTLPYNAHVACSDALWAGLPVLTNAGESFAGRVSASMINAIGLPELITNSEKEYENRAIELATNPDLLEKIKKKLEANRITKPLFDTKLYTKHIEMGFYKMHERYNKNLPTENIEI